MEEKISWDLIYNLLQIIKQFPRLKIKQRSTDDPTQSEYELLMILAINHDKYQKAITVTEISSLLQITPAGVTHMINSLEAADCIKRLPDPKDRRVVLVGLTDKGKQVARNYMVEIQERLNGLFNYLGEEDSQTLINLLARALAFFSAEPGS